MSGLHLRDLDGDGDIDIVFTNGDTFDYDIPDGINPNELHGVAWLENDGLANFTYHDLVRTWGVYDTVMYDYDDDGDQDIFAISYHIENQFFTSNRDPLQSIIVINLDCLIIWHDTNDT